MAAKKKKQTRTHVGLRATRWRPLGFDLRPSALKRLNRNTVVVVAILAVAALGYIFFRGSLAGTRYPATMVRGTTLRAGGHLQSPHNYYYATFQSDGNFVIFRSSDHAVMWASYSQGRGGVRMVYQSDGNLVIYNSSGKAVWHTHSNNQGGTHITLQDDSNFVNYTATSKPIWSSHFGLYACINPFEGTSYKLSRIDQGVDYIPNSYQAIKAPCRGKVLSTTGTLGTGWPGGVYIHFKFDPGIHSPIAGKCAYFAERIALGVKVGDVVRAGDPLGIADVGQGNPPGSQEWGWSYSVQTPVTQKSGEVATEGGWAWDRFIASLGGPNHGPDTSHYPVRTTIYPDRYDIYGKDLGPERSCS